MGQRLAKKVLLLGWDAADWKHITPLLDQGLMPTMEKFINGGVMGNIATLQPMLSPMLWNSIATGVRPDKHGILGFIEPDPQTGRIRTVSSTSRKVKALWNILTQRGFKTHVVGWWAGHPAEPINGVAVSDLFPTVTGPSEVAWPMPPGTVHPQHLAETFAELRLHPAELEAEQLLPFIPRAAEIDQAQNPVLEVLAKQIAQCCSIHNAATWILENQEWDFLAVYDISIDHFCHGFIGYHPPRIEEVPEDQFELYKDVVNGAYRFHDMLLERLLQLAGPEATVILVSDHGFHSDHLRPTQIPSTPTGPAVQHRPYGIFCMNGPHVRQDERIYGANLLDVAPTILHLFGLPVGADMEGRVLLQALENPTTPERIPSWETEPGECGMHPPDTRVDAGTAEAVLEQLVALGYMEPLSDDATKARQLVLREEKYNLGEVYLYSDRPRQALPLFQELAEENPEELRFLMPLAQCHLKLGQIDSASEILEGVLKRNPELPRASFLLGLIRLEQGDTAAALENLLRAEQADPRMPELHTQIGNAYLKLWKLDDADRAFHLSLSIDPDNPHAHLGLALTRLRQKRYREAAEESLSAVGLLHHLPWGHYYLGVALSRLAQWDRAVLAFETCVAMAPGLAMAHRWLAAIHHRPGGDPVREAEHRRLAREVMKRRAKGVFA